ncbi:hypothetical protein BWQ96_10231 [Gracilariopsis chorda]|uniref:Uncharacterized protein n=1 Tax=Gracilariopsis chorda TaxID=448386 RepID=A0A2V3IDA1_9FLOR|nr:hypothetical protein BWQ96_10231 [Gracilariopsis chorda]|eukprot:PXF40062.1 hypothetical protein BWQ96_10231 [Gracilariopsis chorda]
MTFLNYLLKLSLVLSIISYAHAGEAVGPCGTAFVDGVQTGSGTITITLTVSLKGQFLPPPIQVGAAGYWFNKNTGSLGSLSTPGDNPVYFRDIGLYIDQWVVTPRSGIVEIGIPLIEDFISDGYASVCSRVQLS